MSFSAFHMINDFISIEKKEYMFFSGYHMINNYTITEKKEYMYFLDII